VTKEQYTTKAGTSMSILVALSVAHMLNDLMHSVIAASYPILKAAQSLNFIQIGTITFVYQIASSMLQPVIGTITDRRPMPYSMIVAMVFTFSGLIGLAFASSYGLVLLAVAWVGIGSSIFHPEAARVIRHAAGDRQGLGQGIFQLGGQAGGALGPVLAAFIIVRRGQPSIVWFALLAFLALVLLVWTARRHMIIRKQAASAVNRLDAVLAQTPRHSIKTIIVGMAILTLLMVSKNAYGESFRSFYTFYLIDHFHLSVQKSQLMLSVLLAAAAAGALIGGLVGDRIGRYRVIWISILGPLPFALLLPHANLFWTGVLTVVINLIMSSAFASILIYAMELMPNRVGLVGGILYGLDFGLGGIAAAALGGLVDSIGIEKVYQICSLIPLAGLLGWFLPRIEDHRLEQAISAIASPKLTE